MKELIGLDIDDVLAQFYPSMCRKYGNKCMITDIWDPLGHARVVALNMHKVENNFRFWLNLDPLSRAIDINFEFDYYITSSPSNMVQYRRDWLMMHGFPNRPVIVSNDKVKDMKRLGISVLIDDKIATLEKVKKAGLKAIQFVPPYMSVVREDLNPIRHLSQVPEILNKINNE